MLKSLRQEQFSVNMLKHVVLIALICPIVISMNLSLYSPDYVLANLFAFLCIVGILLQGPSAFEKKNVLGWILVALLVIYNGIMLYVNAQYHQWYLGQVNMTISFLLFVLLLFCKKETQHKFGQLIPLLLTLAVITAAVSLLYYFNGYYGIRMLWVNVFDPVKTADGSRPENFNWVYLHKSEYAFILILFIALLVRFRKRFKYTLVWLGGIAVLMATLVATDTKTSLLASVLVFCGLLLDFVVQRKGWIRWLPLALLPIVGLAAVYLITVIGKERDWGTLGYRTYIWEGMFKVILDTPEGMGKMAGCLPHVMDMGFSAYNAHNVFMNLLYQFSIPAGLCGVAMFVSIIVASIVRRFSFLTLGIWGALLIPMTMDWCLTMPQYSIFLVCIYFLFFYPEADEKETKSTETV